MSTGEAMDKLHEAQGDAQKALNSVKAAMGCRHIPAHARYALRTAWDKLNETLEHIDEGLEGVRDQFGIEESERTKPTL